MHAPATMADNVRIVTIGSITLGWLIAEVVIALGIAVAIVWWTIPRKPKGDAGEPPREGDKR